MKMSVVKAPFGPEYTLYEGEFFAITRHRVMIFFYFGLVCLILVASIGRTRQLGKPELVIGFAAILVMAGIAVVVVCRLANAWWAMRRGRIPRFRLAPVLIATVAVCVLLSELLEPPLFGTARSSAMHLLMKFTFYLTLTELLTSILLQYTMGYILDDLRRGKTFAADGSLISPPDDAA